MPIQLSEDDDKALRGLKKKIDEARLEIERAKLAGLDVSDHEAALNHAVELRDGLLATYSPAVVASKPQR